MLAAIARGRTSGPLRADAASVTSVAGRAVGLVAARPSSPDRAGRRTPAHLGTLTLTVLPRRLAARLAPRTHIAQTPTAGPPDRRLVAGPARTLARARTVGSQRVPRHAVLARAAAVTRPVTLHLSLDAIGAFARALYSSSPLLE